MDAADAVLHRLWNTREGRADPYPHYRRLRELAPLYRSRLDGLWYATRYADCEQILRDPRFGRKPARLMRGCGTGAEAFAQFRERMRTSMLTEDPPEHTRLRRLVSPFFTAGAIKALRPRIEQLAHERLDMMAAQGNADAIADLASPLPLTIIGELVGVPAADLPRCRQLMEATIAADCPDPSRDVIEQARLAGDAMEAYFAGLISRRRARPAGGLLDALIASDQLNEEELVSMAVLMLIAASTTTANLIGNGLLALLRHPDEFDRVRRNPTLVPAAVEEMLRYDAPVQTSGRTALEEVEVGGQVLAAHDMVVTWIGAANRDPARFADPDRFDVGRVGNAALSFGGGVHRCLGAGLAALQAQIVFSALMEKFHAIELLDHNPPLRPTLDQHGPQALPIGLVPN